MDSVALPRKGRRGERARFLFGYAGDTLECRQLLRGGTGRPVGRGGRCRR